VISAINSAWEGASDNLRGAFWMLCSAVTYTAMAVLLRLLADRHYPESEMLFARCGAGLLMLAPVMLTKGMGVWRAPRPWLMLVRCLFTTIGLFTAFYAFAHMDLAGAQALSFTRALFVTVLAAWMLHEIVGVRRWSAIVIGFLGVMVMLRPGAESFSLAALAALSASFFTALSVVLVKDLMRDHSVMTQVLWLNLVTTLCGLPFAFAGGNWLMPGWGDFLLLLGLGFTGVTSQSFYVRALALGDASLMGMMDYSRLPLMLVAGLIVFGQRPDLWAMVGAAIVIASTLYITLREAQLAKIKPAIIEP
jgi:drug/metabolite transporter (DMT)-like permease